MNSKQYKNSYKFFASIGLVVLIVCAISPLKTFASENNPSIVNPVVSNNYVIQLNSNDEQALKNNLSTSKIEKLFEFNSSVKFGNTYKFTSTKTLEQLRNDLSGQYISLDSDHEVKAGDIEVSALPNDPAFTTSSLNTDKQWGLVKANFIDAWEKTTGKKNITVAVIDTGVDASHEDLSGTRFVPGFNAIDDTRISGRVNSDDNGHGTLITGVIAATSNNNIGIAGAAPNISIMPIKALSSDGSGTSSKLSEAIVWAADHKADVINLSLGGIGFGHDKVLADAITYAFEKNIVIVAAAGNDVAITGGNLDNEPVFPICDDNGKNMVIGVTATDYHDLKPGFANYGKACVDVSAPGKRILSTINHDPASGGIASDAYAYASGTSLSVPFVSAQAALLRSLFPEASNKQIRDRIISTAENIDGLNLSQCANQSCKGLLGGGRIDVAKSLEEQILKLVDGDLARVAKTNNFYYINGGKKQIVSRFVQSQRFNYAEYKTVTLEDLSSFPEGSYAEPLDGTLVKTPSDGTVYYMEAGLRRPLSYQVFKMRQYNFSNIVTLPEAEVNSWIIGSFFSPPDGTIVRSKTKPTIYWVVNGSLRPLSYNFYTSKKLNKIPITYISDGDISKFPKGEAYIN